MGGLILYRDFMLFYYYKQSNSLLITAVQRGNCVAVLGIALATACMTALLFISCVMIQF